VVAGRLFEDEEGAELMTPDNDGLGTPADCCWPSVGEAPNLVAVEPKMEETATAAAVVEEEEEAVDVEADGEMPPPLVAVGCCWAVSKSISDLLGRGEWKVRKPWAGVEAKSIGMDNKKEVREGGEKASA
jgi:hypothetical protein